MKIQFEKFDEANDAAEALREEAGIEDGFDLSDYKAAYDSVEVARSGDKIIVGMLNYDSNPQDFFDDDEGAGKLIQFRSASERDNKVAELSKTKKLFYLLNKYEHGGVHYSVSGTKSYPDEQWDVSHGCAIYLPSDYIQAEYRKMKRTDGEGAAYEHFVKGSNETLDSYSDWCNGDVYGYSVITFDKEGNELDCDQCWGYIGTDNGNEEKRGVMKHIILSDELNKLMENIIIEKVSPEKAELPFKITKKGLEELSVAHVYDTYVVGAKYEGEDNVTVYNWSEGQEKPIKAKFEEWQKNHGVTSEQFMVSRMSSDIRDVIKKNLDNENKSENKLSM
jgi:hypothetical protein